MYLIFDLFINPFSLDLIQYQIESRKYRQRKIEEFRDKCLDFGLNYGFDAEVGIKGQELKERNFKLKDDENQLQEELAKIGGEELENILLELDYLKDSINGLEQKRTNAKTYNSEINLIVRQHSDRLNELRNASDSKELVALKSHLESAEKDYEQTEKSLVEWEKHDSLSENSKANQTEEYNVKPVMSGTVNNEQIEPNEC